MSEKKEISRRKYLKYLGLGVGGAAVATTAAYFGYQALKPHPEIPTPDEHPLHFTMWTWDNELVREELNDFEEQYNDKVILDVIHADYSPVLETKLMAGTPVDVGYSHVESTQRWHHAGWIYDLRNLPGIEEISNAQYPASLEAATSADGSLLGMVYFQDVRVFYRNNKLLTEAGYGDVHPKNYDELYDICLDLKNQGLVEYPFEPALYPMWYAMPVCFYSDCLCYGDDLVDADLNATFDIDTPIVEVLEAYNRFHEAGLIPPSATTMSEPEHHSMFMTGNTAFTREFSLFRFLYNDLGAAPAVDGQATVNEYLMGIKMQPLMDYNFVSIFQNPRKPHPDWKLDRIANLFKFFAWKDKNGEFRRAKDIMELANLVCGNKALMEGEWTRQQVLKNCAKPEDWDIALGFFENAVAGRAYRAIWWKEWKARLYELLPEAVTGAKEATGVVTDLRDLWDELKARYT